MITYLARLPCRSMILIFLFSPVFVLANNCIECHKDNIFRTQNPKLFRYYSDWKSSTHNLAGVTCSDCHGGNPEAKTPEEAHIGGFIPSNPLSKVNYRNLPKTCGQCHQEIYQNFVESNHYKALINEEKAPHCATCHGSINSKAYFTTIVTTTCTYCHGSKHPDMPQIIDESEKILSRLNIIKGYLGWTKLYYQYRDKSEEAETLKRRFDELSNKWHRFKSNSGDEDSAKLLSDLRQIYDKATTEMKQEGPTDKR